MSTELSFAGVSKSEIDEIRQLHADVLTAARTTLDRAITAGGKLSSVRAKLKHGQWLPFVKHVGIDDQTARNYIRVWDNRDRLKSLNVRNLTEAYAAMLPAKPSEPTAPIVSPTSWTATTNHEPAETAEPEVDPRTHISDNQKAILEQRIIDEYPKLAIRRFKDFLKTFPEQYREIARAAIQAHVAPKVKTTQEPHTVHPDDAYIKALGPKYKGVPISGISSGKSGEAYARAVLNRLTDGIHSAERQDFVENLKKSIEQWQKDNPRKAIRERVKELLPIPSQSEEQEAA
jgi:hypothetical protein